MKFLKSRVKIISTGHIISSAYIHSWYILWKRMAHACQLLIITRPIKIADAPVDFNKMEQLEK